MSSVKYVLLEEKFSLGGNNFNAYGIIAVSDCIGQIETEVIETVHNISPVKEEVMLLIERCNRYRLSPIHLSDVVEDFLVSK